MADKKKDIGSIPYKDREVTGMFLVKQGVHNEGGKTYMAGEVVESCCDLDRWPDKFQRLDPKTGLPADIELPNMPKSSTEQESKTAAESRSSATSSSSKSGR